MNPSDPDVIPVYVIIPLVGAVRKEHITAAVTNKVVYVHAQFLAGCLLFYYSYNQEFFMHSYDN